MEHVCSFWMPTWGTIVEHANIIHLRSIHDNTIHLRSICDNIIHLRSICEAFEHPWAQRCHACAWRHTPACVERGKAHRGVPKNLQCTPRWVLLPLQPKHTVMHYATCCCTHTATLQVAPEVHTASCCEILMGARGTGAVVVNPP